jgi:hypothetical protein
MKYIKKFESNKDEPKIGDYVLTRSKSWNHHLVTIANNKITNNIGKIINIGPKSAITNSKIVKNYYVKHGNQDWWFIRDEIIYWSENKEELELILQANKYNL